MPKNWNRRFKHNRDKMKTGDIFELAEVVRNLSLRDHEKGLSTGEKQMFVKAKKILASELMYAKGIDEEEAGVWLDEVLVGERYATTAPKKKTATPVEEHDVGQRKQQGRRGAHQRVARLGRSRRSRTRRTARRRPAEGVRAARRPAAARRERSERLEDSDWIDEIVVAAPPGWEEPASCSRRSSAPGKVSAVVAGGATRAESVRLALAEVPTDAAVVLVHDAARPLAAPTT